MHHLMDGKYNKSLIKDFITTSKIVLRHTTVDRLTEEINNLSKEIQQYIKLVNLLQKTAKTVLSSSKNGNKTMIFQNDLYVKWDSRNPP